MCSVFYGVYVYKKGVLNAHVRYIAPPHTLRRADRVLGRSGGRGPGRPRFKNQREGRGGGFVETEGHRQRRPVAGAGRWMLQAEPL
mgnify:CR=1 FL=1